MSRDITRINMLKHTHINTSECQPMVACIYASVYANALSQTHEISRGIFLMRNNPRGIFLMRNIPYEVQCTPDISRSCISRNWIYRGRMLDAIFLNLFHKFCRHGAQECDIFREIGVTHSTPLAGDYFLEICSMQ